MTSFQQNSQYTTVQREGDQSSFRIQSWTTSVHTPQGILAVSTQRPGRGKKSCVQKSRTRKPGKDEWSELLALMDIPDNPNVISPIGQCVGFWHPEKREKTTALVLPFLQNGSLRDYLDKLDAAKSPLDSATCMLFAEQMAHGLKHVHEHGYIHRDIAARNFLLNEHNVVVLADFGMARQMVRDDNYFLSDAEVPLPLKRCPPEVSLDWRFSQNQYVWSLRNCISGKLVSR
eukprot:TRINITY_DN3666_c0_g1_i1.p1 TRINITY_DN3666_c0_g1~~TRINITY_DN3666_c0_g1_i1.p1  ORF type:complete len:231 (+),score=33.29 TRINITY_DN3666_c0_g1_i1:68-760(+)